MECQWWWRRRAGLLNAAALLTTCVHAPRPPKPRDMAELDASLLPTEADLVFEEELLRTPHQMKVWWRYLDARKDATTAKRHLLYERALRALPGSYKLWHAYLAERLELARRQTLTSPAYEALNNAFERALVTMHKMPRIWELYLHTLLEQRLLTRTRRACDRALAALPVTQHERVWTIYLVRAWWRVGAAHGPQP